MPLIMGYGFDVCFGFILEKDNNDRYERYLLWI